MKALWNSEKQNKEYEKKVLEWKNRTPLRGTSKEVDKKLSGGISILEPVKDIDMDWGRDLISHMWSMKWAIFRGDFIRFCRKFNFVRTIKKLLKKNREKDVIRKQEDLSISSKEQQEINKKMIEEQANKYFTPKETVQDILAEAKGGK